MSAVWKNTPPTCAAMTPDDLDAVMAIEVSAYAFAWSRGNFVDSLAAGHPAWVLFDDNTQRCGYAVAMAGVDEMHLLNITVAPAHQGQGLARYLLDAVVAECQQRGAQQLWLEVRTSNLAAQRIYAHWGFVAVGLRKGYYPASRGVREDAQVMRLQIEGVPHALA
jgi:[ribosomal protein S18]-alanine N-acetyltransferase